MWAWVRDQPVPQLERPPIVEVICGLIFPPVDIDPVSIGAFWADRRERFPTRQYLDPLEGPQMVAREGAAEQNGMQFVLEPAGARVRTWLVSADQSRVLQFQHDRFYLNWRARGGAYPRFSGDNGLKRETLETFAEFQRSCGDLLGVAPAPSELELGKVDLLIEGEVWNGLGELVALVPSIAHWLQLGDGPNPGCGIRFKDRSGTDEIQVGIETTFLLKDGVTPTRALKIETTLRAKTSTPTLDADFVRANKIVNSMFARLIPDEERPRRFGSPA